MSWAGRRSRCCIPVARQSALVPDFYKKFCGQSPPFMGVLLVIAGGGVYCCRFVVACLLAGLAAGSCLGAARFTELTKILE
jgi:hypothetical protein